MILLDTNVVSELMRFEPHPRVSAWVNEKVTTSLCLCSVVLAEQMVGIEMLPAGKRKSALNAAFEEIRNALFAHSPTFDFGEQSAYLYAKLIADTSAKGVSIGVGDGQIAAIALENDLIVATRDTAPFVAAGVRVIDPWGN